MKKIEIRGVIVPSVYDASEYMQRYIDKGVITPESRVRAALKDHADDTEVYISSQGGSVFAGYEMANAFRDWKAATGKGLTLTIGAMAASAAANLITQVPADKVRAHKNAKFMFHGAATETWGGEGAHQDSKDLLNKINSEVKTALITRYKMSPETVAEWFSEGRMGWMTAAQAKTAGMVDEIIGEDAPALQVTKADVAGLAAKGIGIAALAMDEGKTVADVAIPDPVEEVANAVTDIPMTEPLTVATPALITIDLTPVEALPEAEKPAEAPKLFALAEVSARCDEAYQDGFAAGKGESLGGYKAEAKAALEKLTAEHRAEVERLTGETVKLAKASGERELQIQALNRKVSKLTPAMAFDADTPKTWKEAVAEIMAEKHCEHDDAFVEAKKRFPELHAQARTGRK